MHVLVIVLYHEEHLHGILARLPSIDVRGATVIESTGMGGVLMDEIPIFAILSRVWAESEGRSHNYTVFSVIKTDETLQKAIDMVKEVVGDISKPGVGILFTVPIDRIEGLAPELPESVIRDAKGSTS